VRSRVIEYYAPRPGSSTRHLAAVCLTDILSDGVSMVYSFFDPDLARDSLGSYVILDHIALARDSGLPHVYLGYWVPGSAKMDYKSRYRPLEIFADGRWTRIEAADTGALVRRRGERSAISEQVAAIELPATR
jgi:arginine-tRNA-protein transferase